MIRIDIINDGTGDLEVGNYDAMVFLPGDGETWVRVEGFTRAMGWAALVDEVIAEVEVRQADARAARQ